MKSPTGRLNESQPEQQYLPGTPEYKATEELRAKFRTAHPNLLVEFKFDLAEARIMGYFDAEGRPHTLPHKDIDVETAMHMFGVTAEQVTPAMRNAAKRRNFFYLYSLPAARYQFTQEDSGSTD